MTACGVLPRLYASLPPVPGAGVYGGGGAGGACVGLPSTYFELTLSTKPGDRGFRAGCECLEGQAGHAVTGGYRQPLLRVVRCLPPAADVVGARNAQRAGNHNPCLDKHQSIPPLRRVTCNPEPEHTVSGINSWVLGSSLIHTELVSLCHDLEFQREPHSKQGGHKCELRTGNGLYSTGSTSAATITENFKLTLLLNKIKDIRQHELSGRTTEILGARRRER